MLNNFVRMSARLSTRKMTASNTLALQLTRPSGVLTQIQQRSYYKDNVLMQRNNGEYFNDPVAVAERVVRLIALHDNVIDPEAVTLNKSWEELGLNGLDLAEIQIALEREFDFEMCEDACEAMTTVNDMVELIARDMYSK